MDSTHIIADVAIPTWLSLVRQAISRVIQELRMIEELKTLEFEQMSNYGHN